MGDCPLQLGHPSMLPHPCSPDPGDDQGGLEPGCLYYRYVIGYASLSVHVALARTAPSAHPLWCLRIGSAPASPCLASRTFVASAACSRRTYFFTTELLLCCTEGMCVNWNGTCGLYLYAHARQCMNRVRWHGAINSTLCMHKHHFIECCLLNNITPLNIILSWHCFKQRESQHFQSEIHVKECYCAHCTALYSY